MRLSSPTYLILHCSDTPDGNGRFRIWDKDDRYSIDAWHSVRGWKRDEEDRLAKRPHLKAVGYHRIINPDGSVAKGRAYNEVGTHAGGPASSVLSLNEKSIGVCMIGSFSFTLPQWYALKEIVIETLGQFKTISEICGHRDVRKPDKPKTCPGFDVREWLSGGMAPLEKHVFS